VILESIMFLGWSRGIFLIAMGTMALSETTQSADGDWPCVQRRVTELSAAQMWAGPPVDSAKGRWRDDPAVASLAQALASRRMSLNASAPAIEHFAEIAGSDKNSKLTLLFAGALELINTERRRLLNGIERYARKQRALAHEIDETGRVLKLGNASDVDRAALERRFQWDTRIYDDRNQALTYVCETPVILEQRAFAIAHEIARYLE
jgi:hypothetical protein